MVFAVVEGMSLHMKIKTLLGVVIFLSMGIPAVGLADARAKVAMRYGAQTYPPNNGEVCTLTGLPPTDVQYEVLARIVASKRTYGSVDELFAPMVREARKIGADAIINLQASQRFKGIFPWRITSPGGDGHAIKIVPESPDLDCLRVGGKLWGTDGQIMSDSVSGAEYEASESVQPGTATSTDTVTEVQSEAEPQVDLYKELLKLDDLRQRGILTNEEFQSEKKKLLDKN